MRHRTCGRRCSKIGRNGDREGRSEDRYRWRSRGAQRTKPGTEVDYFDGADEGEAVYEA